MSGLVIAEIRPSCSSPSYIFGAQHSRRLDGELDVGGDQSSLTPLIL
jgi:hypothetical protein